MTRENAAKRLRGTGTRNISPEGRARMAAAGKANLSAFLAAHKQTAQEANEAAAVEAKKLIDAAIAELGGEDALSARQRHLLANQRALLFIVLASSAYLERTGPVASRGKPRAVLAMLGSYINSLRLNCEALGLSGTVPHTGESLEDIQREYAQKARQ